MNLFISVFILFCGISLIAQETDTYVIAGKFYDSEQNILLLNKVIHVQGGEIKKIGNEEIIPEEARVIDLSNFTVLPGLIDSHTHVLFSQKPDEDFSERTIQTISMESDGLRTLRGAKRVKSYLDVGITTIKDLGNSGMFLDVNLRDAINEKTTIGPRMFVSGPIMSSSGGQIYGVKPEYQDLIHEEYRVVTGVDDAKNAVREHLNQNVDLIKICADNLPNNTRLTIDEMKAIVETAHSYGLTVTAHSVSNQSAWEAVQAGVDGIEHAFFIADSTLTLMAQKNIFLVPTENSRDYMDRYYELAGRKVSFIDRYLDDMKNRLHKAIDKGVPIVAGSDNYTDIQTSRGVSSFDMFKAYYEAGMKPMDILRSATFLPAKYLKKEKEIGVLKEGAKADIIAVQGDLETDFFNALKNISFVMKEGEVYINKSEQ